MKQLSLKEIQDKYASGGVSVSSAILRGLQRDPRAGARRLYKVLAKRYEEQKKERNRLDAMLHFERLLWKAGIQHIAGVDEVGMGPLAGPVVAAAVIFPRGVEIDGIDDSKALDEETRKRLQREIHSRASAVAIGVVEVEEIDRINIYRAGIRAMQLALENLPLTPQHILVDSRTIPGFIQPQNSFDKGDGINFSIAAASIVAKVYRDGLMTELDRRYPGYGFAGHKGYATPEHQRAIRELGPCPIHRRSFDYIREICGQYCDLYYSLKEQGYACKSRRELGEWEAKMKAAAESLSINENKKLHLMAGRLWKRMTNAG
ncbi:MAG: ribonuclease HII [Acidobacteria bacterium 13_1_20CM_2_55_15]|nr:MAG: ribonuclease HII [Acidobacteria bacterium 13_1_40CM_56_16]OLD68625.1 MAG: ribonuclease HII [Acidobacteria bacterium 13_1_40CM_2_56_11]OLE88400.1 MAG: ribonuclease HII [Acidobacteria bacterium 13_1_20CM_2_55_15]